MGGGDDDTAPMEETLPDGTMRVEQVPAHHARLSETSVAGDDRARLVEPTDEHVIEVRDVEVRFGSFVVFKGLNLDVRRGEILGFVGGSGQGKSVLMRTILDLVPKYSGSIRWPLVPATARAGFVFLALSPRPCPHRAR